jgi:hypothetical protein
MLFGETAGGYCENHTEHTDTLCGKTKGYKINIFSARPVNVQLFTDSSSRGSSFS